MHRGESVDACKSYALYHYGVNDSDWQEGTLTIEDMMKAYAMDAIANAKNKFGVHLDLSPASLQEVEKILGQLSYSRPRGIGRLFRRSAPAEVEAQAKIWGAYVGEVIRRAHGGEWPNHSDAHPNEVIMTLRVGTTDIFPPSKVLKRLSNGPEDDVWFYYRALTERILKK